MAVELGKVVFARPDSSQRIARLSAVPMDDCLAIGIARDITNELEKEEQLRRSQKLEAIGTLAGGSAHDFNNILTAILGYAELGLVTISPENKVKKNLEAIYTSGKRARDLILKEALKFLRPVIPATIDIRQNIDSKSHILGDPTKVHQIVMNL